MLRFRSQKQVQIDDPDDSIEESVQKDDVDGDQSENRLTDGVVDVSPDIGCQSDYVGILSRPYLLKVLRKQGDKQVCFADRVLKFTGSGKMKHRILLITEFAIYIVDPETNALKRRISLAAVEKIFLSELSDNFFAIIIPTEYDLLLASTRKTEIVCVFAEAIKSASSYELDVVSSNRFEYNADAELVKEVIFEEVEGGVKTRIVRK